DEWLTVRGPVPGPLLCPVYAPGQVRIARMTGGGIFKIMAKRCQEAGVPPHTPHDWRHTLATALHAPGVPLREIQEQLGHAQITTTQQYMHVDPAALKRNAALLTIERPTRA